MIGNALIQPPDMRSLLNAHRDEVFSSFNCHQIGTIVSFDASKQTATVQINTKRVVYNSKQEIGEKLKITPIVMDYPVLEDVPVFVATGGKASLRLPVTAGDTCLLFFNDRDIDAWFASGSITIPNSSRMHSLSDALAIVGFRSSANKIDDYSATDAELRFDQASVVIKPDGKVIITAKNGGKITLDTKLEIKNSATSLLTALNAVVTALTALNAKTGPTAAPQIALAQTEITNLLQ